MQDPSYHPLGCLDGCRQPGAKAMRRRAKPEVKVIYFRILFKADEDGDGSGKTVLPPADQPVQLAMFAS
jgi:hypothetical protein